MDHRPAGTAPAHTLGASAALAAAVICQIALVIASVALAAPACRADTLLDEGVRAAMLKRPNGRIAHIETEYNDIFITKRQNLLTMSFQIKGWDYTESVSNLLDPDDLPLRYAQVMMIATIYPTRRRRS